GGEDAHGVHRALVELGPSLGGLEGLGHVGCILSPGSGRSAARVDQLRGATAGRILARCASFSKQRPQPYCEEGSGGVFRPDVAKETLSAGPVAPRTGRARRLRAVPPTRWCGAGRGEVGRCPDSRRAWESCHRGGSRLERFVATSGRDHEEGRWAVTATQGASIPSTGQGGDGSARRSAKSVIGAYVALTKPRIIELLLITTDPTMVLAAAALPAGGANALNTYLDRDIDAKMKRTRNRPIPSGAVSPRAALIFGLVLSVVSAVWLGLLVNWVSAALAIGAILLYVVFYTMIL